MRRVNTDVAGEIRRYLETGEYDPAHSAWSGENLLDRIQRGHRALGDALVAEVRRRAAAPPVPAALRGLDLVHFTRRKAEPMIRGLFPRKEQEVVLSLVERAVVFVTAENVESVLLDCDFPHSAWRLANLYLASANATLLTSSAPDIVGFSEGLNCFVSTAYFETKDTFSDFVVHEVAHIFHNCKRRTAGLPETRHREWLLDIAFQKRETFAYACEAYARIMEHARMPVDRQTLAREFAGFNVADDRVDPGEVAEVVRAACARRNGWKLILDHCAPLRFHRIA